MVIHELTADECRTLLRQTNLGRLSCALNDQPYIVPVYFDFDGEHLYGFAALGQKIEWMRANPRVCLEVDDITDQSHWTTVVVLGRYEELPHTPEHEASRRRAQELFQKRPEWWHPATSGEHYIPVVYRIWIGHLTGRRATHDRAQPVRVISKNSQTKAPHWWSNVQRSSRRNT